MAITNYVRNLAGKAVENVGTMLNLPEGRISEKLAGNWTPLTNVTPQSQAVYGGNPQPYYNASVSSTQNNPQVLGSRTTLSYPTGGGSSGGGQVLGSNTMQLPQTGDNGQGYQSEQDLINDEYNSFNSYLNSQEGLANQRFNDLQTNLTNEKGTALTDLTGQQNVRNQQLDTQAAKGRQQERLDLSKVRQLLSDLEQKNAARIAITGGGSVNDALAESFGRTAQQQTGNVLAAGQDYQSQVEGERMKAQNFYETKRGEINNFYTNELAKARQILNENLANIGAERTASANQKQRATLQAYRDYINTRDNARLQAANFQAQYDLWKRELDAKLSAGQGYQVGNAQYNAPQIYSDYGFDMTGQTPAVGEQLPATMLTRATGRRPEDEQLA